MYAPTHYFANSQNSLLRIEWIRRQERNHHSQSRDLTSLTTSWFISVGRTTSNNVYSDIVSGNDSDHYPVIAEIRIKVKANDKKVKSKLIVQPCTEKEQQVFNQALSATQPANITHSTTSQWIKQAAEKTMTKREVTRRPLARSEETEQHLEQKRHLNEHGASYTELKDIRQNNSYQIHSERQTTIQPQPY